MANILKSIQVNNGFRQNSTQYDITITLDSDITSISELNSTICNNGSNYGKVEGITYIPTGSSCTIYTPTKMIVASFVAESGAVNTSTTYQEGDWRVLSVVTFKTTI